MSVWNGSGALASQGSMARGRADDDDGVWWVWAREGGGVGGPPPRQPRPRSQPGTAPRASRGLETQQKWEGERWAPHASTHDWCQARCAHCAHTRTSSPLASPAQLSLTARERCASPAARARHSGGARSPVMCSSVAFQPQPTCTVSNRPHTSPQCSVLRQPNHALGLLGLKWHALLRRMDGVQLVCDA